MALLLGSTPEDSLDTLKELSPVLHQNPLPWLAQMSPWLNWHQWQLILPAFEIIHLAR